MRNVEGARGKAILKTRLAAKRCVPRAMEMVTGWQVVRAVSVLEKALGYTYMRSQTIPNNVYRVAALVG